MLFVVVVDDDDGVGCRMTGTEGIALSPGPTLCGLSSVTELLDELELEVESSDDDEKDDVVTRTRMISTGQTNVSVTYLYLPYIHHSAH